MEENENNNMFKNNNLFKIMNYLETIEGEVSYKDVAQALSMPPDFVKSLISGYVQGKQKELEKNPLLALSGPDSTMKVLIYKIKELSKARFYIEGQEKLMKLTQSTSNLKQRVMGFFKGGD